MADVFAAHLEWTGAAKGPTLDPATFSRDLEVTVDEVTPPMSSTPVEIVADLTFAERPMAAAT